METDKETTDMSNDEWRYHARVAFGTDPDEGDA